MTWVKPDTNPLVSGSDIGQDQVGYPTVIRAEGRLSSPLDNWYMWCAPHDAPGNIYLFTASTPEGPWTIRNSGNPVIPTSAISGADHVSSPFVLWNPNTSELMMWAHAGGFSDTSTGGTQRTYLWTSADGITWTIANGGAFVLGGTGVAGDIDEKYVAYMNVVRNAADDGFIAYYQGAIKSSGREGIASATSADGVTWTRENTADGNRAWGHPAYAYYRPVPYWGASKLEVLFTTFAPLPAQIYEKTRQSASSHTADRTPALSETAGGFYKGGVVPGDAVYYDGKLWVFYTAHEEAQASVGDEVGVAYQARSRGEFDTTWGKG